MNLRWRWFQWVTAGECVGFALPALIAAVVTDAPPVVLVAALLLAGAGEGAVLGWVQAHVLRSVLPGFPVGDWVVRTAVAAVVAWALGLELSTLSGPLWLTIPVAALLGGLLLVIIGFAQWTVLRACVQRAGRWIWITAGAWAAGLAAFAAVTSPLWMPGQSTTVVVAIGLVGGLTMAACMAAITAAGIEHLIRTSARREHPIRSGPPR